MRIERFAQLPGSEVAPIHSVYGVPVVPVTNPDVRPDIWVRLLELPLPISLESGDLLWAKAVKQLGNRVKTAEVRPHTGTGITCEMWSRFVLTDGQREYGDPWHTIAEDPEPNLTIAEHYGCEPDIGTLMVPEPIAAPHLTCWARARSSGATTATNLEVHRRGFIEAVIWRVA